MRTNHPTQQYPTMYDIVTHALDQAYWSSGNDAYARIRDWWEERGRRARYPFDANKDVWLRLRELRGKNGN